MEDYSHQGCFTWSSIITALYYFYGTGKRNPPTKAIAMFGSWMCSTCYLCRHIRMRDHRMNTPTSLSWQILRSSGWILPVKLIFTTTARFHRSCWRNKQFLFCSSLIINSFDLFKEEFSFEIQLNDSISSRSVSFAGMRARVRSWATAMDINQCHVVACSQSFQIWRGMYNAHLWNTCRRIIDHNRLTSGSSSYTKSDKHWVRFRSNYTGRLMSMNTRW